MNMVERERERERKKRRVWLTVSRSISACIAGRSSMAAVVPEILAKFCKGAAGDALSAYPRPTSVARSCS